MADITGATSILLMLADPVSHIRGTILINDALAALGLDAVIVPIHVTPTDLETFLASARRMQNVAGLGITIPHKIAACVLVDELTPVARRMGATNFVRRNADGTLTGTNTDGAGFMEGLRVNGFDATGKRALLVGTGGVGRAIAFGLAEAGLARLDVMNRDRGKAEALATEVQAAFPSCRVDLADASSLKAADLLVNGTSLGMKTSDPLPLELASLTDRTTVAEVVVQPAMTRLLSDAAARGCPIIAGAEMLKPQPAIVAEFFGLLRRDG
ncbi:shikimate 5-dehydrogenase [Gemmobacter aquaticus]|uniref:shikimate dehydrogenase (NADP(+)) n=1 Tax=Gemmobacter aquaticus TaxID=490185 RepID=A0A917YKE8_9RHOB|nr:shikimate dehydrogenase [Gemmobacter aquaticus]GGO34514.1 shikimate 5-dehydrogenase [Gemmobacter aquaticus]